ncbi:hypothetical protein [Eggerthella guodeyinii]|uniref:Uncharacterized protein n=1 Tax=Eggerthella guodeyinii TaxID=2690837 RepID=A0A6N7RJI8_9ACTN|nr:hypothetical protein [Eggerthella guodeyinii]MRX81284.1 hypothetical protein [Eggerthella guodeyinii]
MSRSAATPVATTLARVGYALAGALAAVLVSAAASLVPWPMEASTLSMFVTAAAMGATLMLWASFKPSHVAGGSVAVEALVVVVTVMALLMVGSSLQSPSLIGHYSNPLSWVWDHVIFMLYSSLGFVLPAAWALGSSERWVRRSWGWVAGEAVFVAAAGVLVASGVLNLAYSLAGFIVQGLLFVAAALAAAAVVQRLVCELVRRSREGRDPAPRPAAPPAERPRPASRWNLRAACIVVLVVSAGISVAALAFFFACRGQAAAQGLELRRVVYDVPTICVFLTCFVAIPFAAIGAAAGPSKDYRVAGCAALCALVLLPTALFSTVRLAPPEETELDDGRIEVVTPVWLDKPRVRYAIPGGLFFMRMLPDVSEAAVPEAEEPLPREQSGYSYHTTGTVASIDAEAQTLELAVTDSTEDLATGERVTVECATAEHFDVPFDELEVGTSVQIRSTEACADGVIVAQKVFGPLASTVSDQVISDSLDDILASYDCPYAITGTVTSAVGEGEFSFRVDDGGGFIENGTELRVSEAFVERRLYGMKGLQWGMDGVVIGFSDLPAEGVLRAKVIVGNDDTSSDYWENMPAA